MEEELTLDELYALVEAQYRREHRQNRFAAALQGVDLDEGKKDDSFEDIKHRAEATLAGRSESEFTFDMIGIDVEDDD